MFFAIPGPRISATAAVTAVALWLSAIVGHAQILDTTFAPNPNASVLTMALQPDDKLLVGGLFTNIGGVARSYLVRLNANGTIDSGFSPAPSQAVYAVAVQADGKILVGGTFATIGGGARGRVARLNADGTLDLSFAPDVGAGIVRSIVVLPDQRIVIGGSFSTVGGQPRSCVARLRANGTIDETFVADATGFSGTNTVLGLALEADGGLLVAGQFSFLKGQVRPSLGRIRADGTLDAGFLGDMPFTNAVVTAVTVMRDGRILVGGSNVMIGTLRRNFARLNRDGTLDLTFAAIVLNTVGAIAEQADGRIVIGGPFISVNNATRTGLARLLPDGTTDPTFPFDATGTLTANQLLVQAILTPPDGRVFVAGSFTNIGTPTRNGIARLVPPALQVVAHPANLAVLPGAAATLAATVTGLAPTFQWRKDGIPLPGATDTTLRIAAAQPGDAGIYDVVATNSLGSVTSRAAALTIISTARLTNVSVRASLANAESLIVGFVVSRGSADVLVRGAGPALRGFGVTNAMTDPRLELYRDSTKLLENDNWPAALAGAFAPIGAFAFELNSRDAALQQSVTGAHSVVASGTAAGVVLVEAYDASAGQGGRLVNVSARNHVGREADILIAGFAASGTGALRVLIRAVGPTIGGPPFGIPGVLSDPALALFDASGSKLVENDNWEPGMAAVFSSAGAFALSPGSKDSAMIVVLTGGQHYTAQIKGADGGTGVALVEIFELP